MTNENGNGSMATITAMPILIPVYIFIFIIAAVISIIVLGEIFPSVKHYFNIKTIPSDL